MNSTPHCYAMPAGAPFARALAEWVWEQYGGDNNQFTQLLLLLPTRRACQTLREAFLEITAGKPMLLPRIQPIGDLDEEDASFFHLVSDETKLPNAIAPVKRHMMLTTLVMQFEKATQGRIYNVEQAAQLAIQLASFLDEVNRQNLSLDGLDKLVPEELAAHWQQTLQFLHIISRHWPDILQAENLVDPAKRRQMLLLGIAAYWKQNPPDYPVIAAGSTGSQPATANLLSVIARLPKGAVILGGLDSGMAQGDWELLEDTHPQYGMKLLLEHIGCERPQVTLLQPDTALQKTDFLRTVFQPPAATAQWAASAIQPDGLNHIRLLTADTQLNEARMIAIALRTALQTPGKTAALVTPDRKLARMVIAQMQRFGITIDDSAGIPLSHTPGGVFLRLIVNMVTSAAAPADILALLRHPFTAAGLATAECRELSRILELELLRGVRLGKGIEPLLQATGHLRLKQLLHMLLTHSKIFSDYFSSRNRAAFSQILSAHLAFAEWLASTDNENGADRLWQGDDGNALSQHLSEIASHAAMLAEIDAASYAGLFDLFLESAVYRPRFGMHPRLHILGPAEARMQQFDLMILGELSEGTWPAHAGVDPWMSRPMRAAFGLPAHERAVGQSALDIYLLSHGREVLWTRARKIDNAPSIASRWWIRLETLVKNRAPGLFSHMVIDTEMEQARTVLDTSEPMDALQAPNPTPPLAARPNRLSVTAIDTWLRDPYMIYARYILKLSALEALDQDPDAADFGSIIHHALEIFLQTYPQALPENAYDALLECGKLAFAEHINRPAIACLWWPRFVSMAQWIAEQEAESRLDIRHIYPEVKGELELNVDGEIFTINTRIDKLSIHGDESFSLVDYKTGAIPDASDQLPLEALVVQHGTLSIPAAHDTILRALEYWKLSGNRSQCEIAEVKTDLAEVRARLEQLVRAYRNPAQPYSAQTDFALQMRYNDYVHLIRRQEWETL